MALVNIKIRPHRRLGLNATPTIREAQASSGTFVQGAPVNFQSGYITACATQSADGNGLAVDVSTGVLGIADEPATASDVSKVCVTPALPGMLFRGQLITSETTAALVALAQTHVGAIAALTDVTRDTHYGVDIGASAISGEPCVKIVELIDAVGTSGGEVGFVFLQAVRHLDVDLS